MVANNYPAPFLAILAKSFHWEGGVANDPNDHGGLTNMGVTKPFLAEAWGRMPSDAEMMTLTKDQAIDAYYKVVWQRWDLPAAPAFLRLEIFNSYTGSVFLGRQCIKAIQAEMKKLGFYGGPIDGDAGAGTKKGYAAIEAFSRDAKWTFNNNVVRNIIGELIDIVRRDPSQLMYLRGWWNRYSEFFDTVGDPTSAPI